MLIILVFVAKSSEQNAILGDFLKSSRVKAGLSQADVAKKIRLSTPQCISNWETGRTSPPMKHIYDICKLYKVDENKLFDLLVDYSVHQTKIKMNEEFENLMRTKHKAKRSS